MYNVILLLFAIFFVVVQLLIINYLFKLEKTGCKCALDWRRNFILFFMVVAVVNLLVTSFLTHEQIPLVQTLVTVLGLVNVIVTLQYVNKLKTEKCECSASIYREIMMYVAIFDAIVYSAALVLVVYILFSIASYAKNIQGKIDRSVSASKSVAVRTVKKVNPLKIVKKVTKRT
jgi:hypothetical protein